MKKLIIGLMVLGILTLGSVFVNADGPWPNPGTDEALKTVKPPITTSVVKPE